MSANWLIHIYHQTLKTECVDRTQGDASRAAETNILIHLEDMVWNSSHRYLRFPLTQIVPYPLISNGVEIKEFDLMKR
ncbi:uncharacterized protein METZ01_LOCUS417225 [marine metagenome]|uniref:Uncharacterized protein n=1 Tax=marine metagenome TaxID=408172 RepID=A0A382X2C8_9ZZZZ